jgi:hypothetical protein
MTPFIISFTSWQVLQNTVVITTRLSKARDGTTFKQCIFTRWACDVWVDSFFHTVYCSHIVLHSTHSEPSFSSSSLWSRDLRILLSSLISSPCLAASFRLISAALDFSHHPPLSYLMRARIEILWKSWHRPGDRMIIMSATYGRKLGHQETIQKSEDMRFTSLENRFLLHIKHSTSLFHR